MKQEMIEIIEAIEWSARNSHAQAISLKKMVGTLKQSPMIDFIEPKSDYRASGCGSCLLAWQKTMGMTAINMMAASAFLLSSLPQKRGSMNK